MKWPWRTPDGTRLTEIRVTHRLSSSDLAALLAHACDFLTDARPQDMSVAAVRTAIRDELTAYGGENLDTDPSDEHHAAVRRAFGTPPGEDHS